MTTVLKLLVPAGVHAGVGQRVGEPRRGADEAGPRGHVGCRIVDEAPRQSNAMQQRGAQKGHWGMASVRHERLERSERRGNARPVRRATAAKPGTMCSEKRKRSADARPRPESSLWRCGRHGCA
eukprot:CAMPEP_0176320602 /NCGR_PEP_ID=MMETSP0121_2-20121125/70910_1 /TAXON_ID=160619 /ORGANISM="Kryptoperidinium foliaceum, Strain CCMP 1326" /LENGTH=123 /DNA_ID=CAMNT_0017663003 /DNA_START=101 /DNA_END=470 /DNA_ORIENTATION=-